MADNPVLADWMRALQGKLPQTQAFPEDPNMGPGMNLVRQLMSGILQMPQTAVAGVENLRPGGALDPFQMFRGPTTPAAPAAAAAPTAPGPVGPISLGLPPRLPASGAVPGTMGNTLMSFPSPTLPQPPMLGAPPQMAQTPGMDMDPIRALLEQGRPKAPDQGLLNDSKFAGILGGLARGAGSVSATEPGSFAKALAMWGAGGQEGVKSGVDKKFEAGQQFNKDSSNYAMTRAGQELSMQKIIADQQHNAALVNFENAKALYQTDVANQKAKYEYELQKAGLEAPKVTQNAQGVLIQQRNPKTGQTDVNFMDLTPTMQKYESMANMLKAAGMPGGEAIMLQNLNSQGLPPPVLDQAYRRIAVKEIFNANAGGAVFGPAYVQAAEAAKKELAKENPALLAKPELYTATLQEKIMARILPLISQRDDWFKVGAPHSFMASVLANASAPPASVMQVPQASPMAFPGVGMPGAAPQLPPKLPGVP